jgi:hypothetical protein
MKDWHTARANGIQHQSSMLTSEQQGPRAKIMLYPYYATLVATSAGMFYNQQQAVDFGELTPPQPPCT